MEEDRKELAAAACQDAAKLEEVIEQLGGTSRIKRQKAASVVALVAEEDAKLLLPYADAIGEGLLHAEAQTRWEVLRALYLMGKQGQSYDEDVLTAAEDALYDESNGVVREAAFRFFCGYGAASPANSDRVWPLIDEAVQCYHGNPEFADMLTHLVTFARGDISMEALTALALRMKFDSESASGTLRMRSEQIVQAFKDRGGQFVEPAAEGEEAEEDAE